MPFLVRLEAWVSAFPPPQSPSPVAPSSSTWSCPRSQRVTASSLAPRGHLGGLQRASLSVMRTRPRDRKSGLVLGEASTLEMWIHSSWLVAAKQSTWKLRWAPSSFSITYGCFYSFSEALEKPRRASQGIEALRGSKVKKLLSPLARMQRLESAPLAN